jgi:hypothetical protein
MNRSIRLIIRSLIVASCPLAMLLCGPVWAGSVLDSIVEATIALDGDVARGC